MRSRVSHALASEGVRSVMGVVQDVTEEHRVAEQARGVCESLQYFEMIIAGPDEQSGRLSCFLERLVELAPLICGHLRERRIADDLLDAAAQLGARQWRRVARAGYWAGDVAGERGEHREGLRGGESARCRSPGRAL